MKTITQILLLLVIGVIAVSCGHDEPDYYSQEASGETFIENGVLVEANTDFSQEMLTYALSKHEWKSVSFFFYDKEHVSDKVSLPGAPLYIHRDGTVEYSEALGPYASIRQYTISGKEMTVSMKDNPGWSNALYPDVVYTVVSVDLKKNSGRIIMDREVSGFVDGLDYDVNSLYLRSVWNYAD
ncbi:MAG: hypothetical protein E7078_06750 [Bacteroidales bacterium]|nr:hypothetical protein [Bacteroidales bacterium]